MYSRDSNLDNAYVLYSEQLANIPAYITLCGNFLLVYTSENVLNIYNISLGVSNGNSKQGGLARLELVRRISLKGIVARVSRVRSISLFNPYYGGNYIFGITEWTFYSNIHHLCRSNSYSRKYHFC